MKSEQMIYTWYFHFPEHNKLHSRFIISQDLDINISRSDFVMQLINSIIFVKLDVQFQDEKQSPVY